MTFVGIVIKHSSTKLRDLVWMSMNWSFEDNRVSTWKLANFILLLRLSHKFHPCQDCCNHDVSQPERGPILSLQNCKIPGTALSRDRSTCDTRPITNPTCSEETSRPLSFVKSLGHWARRMANWRWSDEETLVLLLIFWSGHNANAKGTPSGFYKVACAAEFWETRLLA